MFGDEVNVLFAEHTCCVCLKLRVLAVVIVLLIETVLESGWIVSHMVVCKR